MSTFERMLNQLFYLFIRLFFLSFVCSVSPIILQFICFHVLYGRELPPGEWKFVVRFSPQNGQRGYLPTSDSQSVAYVYEKCNDLKCVWKPT